MAHLMLQFPDGRSSKFPIQKPELFVGRDASCDITLKDGITSRRHARLFSDGEGHYWIQDLRSKNGISLNDQPISEARIQHGDRIGIGTCQLTLFAEPLPTVVLQETSLETQTGATSAWRADERLDLPRKRLETLYELNERLTGRLDRDDLLNELLDVCTEQLRFERTGIAVWPGKPHPLQWIHLRNIGADSSGTFSISRSVVDRALYHAERILIVDTEEGEFDPTVSMVSNNIRSAMCVPMEYLQEVHGVIYGDRVSSTGGYGKEDIDFLAALGRLGAMGLANVQLVEEMRHRQQVEIQLQLARQIQSNLFPAEPLEMKGVQIHGLNDPGLAVSGDYYDYFLREDGLIMVVIADVAGKGVPASLLTANLQAAIRVMLTKEKHLVETVEALNRLICENTGDASFITAIIGLLDPANRTFTYVNAGHHGPYLIREEKHLEKLDEADPCLPFGVESNATYQLGKIELPSSPSTLVFYTDGVPDAENEQREHFQEDRFSAALESNFGQPPGELITRVRRSIKQFTRNHVQTDDITLVAVKLD
ncbi:MAG: SpoIIE family protein phosphatase [Phycisphaerales bacterium]|nr:SpoIIE family protein phosphatase [Phycisphaerales bacterium]